MDALSEVYGILAQKIGSGIWWVFRARGELVTILVHCYLLGFLSLVKSHAKLLK